MLRLGGRGRVVVAVAKKTRNLPESQKAKTRLVSGFFRIVVPGLGIDLVLLFI